MLHSRACFIWVLIAFRWLRNVEATVLTKSKSQTTSHQSWHLFTDERVTDKITFYGPYTEWQNLKWNLNLTLLLIAYTTSLRSWCVPRAKEKSANAKDVFTNQTVSVSRSLNLRLLAHVWCYVKVIIKTTIFPKLCPTMLCCLNLSFTLITTLQLLCIP